MYQKVAQSEAELGQTKDHPVVRRNSWCRCVIVLLLLLGAGGAMVYLIWPRGETALRTELDYESTLDEAINDGDDEISTDAPVSASSLPPPETTIQVPEDAEVENHDNTKDEVKTSSPAADMTAGTGSSLVARCSNNWSVEFSEKYENTCKFWLSRFAVMDKTVTSESRVIGYYCESPRDCQGWGDRLGGIENAFIKSVNEVAQFRIGHRGLNHLFSPCLFSNPLLNWAELGLYEPSPKTCKSGRAVTCQRWLSPVNCKSLLTVDTDRTCMTDGMCKALAKFTPEKLNIANTLGCGLRAILEPSKDLLQGTKIDLRIGNAQSVSMTVKEAEAILKTYFIISIHFRLGDEYAFEHQSGNFSIQEEKYARPFHCAQTLESYLAKIGGADGEMFVKGKPVRWFLASDSFKLKELAVKAFSDRIIMLDDRPEHVALHFNKDDFSRTIAEWYLLGLGDELILNKIGTFPGDFYYGRTSAFAKTSWAYHLKHVAYSAGYCRAHSIPFEGTWQDLKERPCQQHSISAKGSSAFPQPHLKLLKENNLTFPNGYVRNGNEIRRAYVGRPLHTFG